MENQVNLTNQFKKYQDKVNDKIYEYAESQESWHYLEVVITIAAVIFFVIFAIRPAVVTIAGLVGEINEKKELTQKMQRKINSIISAQEEFAYVQGQRDLLESYLPSTFSITQGVAQVAGAAKDSNLTLPGLSISQIEDMINPGDELSGLEFNVSSNADYEEIKTFIEQVKTVRRWMDIDSYQISLSDDEEVSPETLSFYLSGKFNYWFEENYGQE